jgi:hypothetical protein
MVRIILPTLGQSQTLGTQATFIGGGSPEQIVNATTLIGSISNAGAQALFKFYTTPNAGDADIPANTSDVTNSNWTALPKATTAGVFVNPTAKEPAWSPGDQNDIRTGQHEMVFKLAEAIFGSNQAGDLLSNPASIMSSFSSSVTTCVAGVNSSNSSVATTDLINGLLYTCPQRFALKYNAVVTAAAYTASKFIGLTAVGVGGAISEVEVTMSATGTVSSISVTGHTSGTFVEGEKVSITDGYGGSDVNIVLTLTANQATDLTNGNNLLTSFATFTPDSASATMGTYTYVTATGTTSGASADVTVLCNSATTVLKLFVTTAATGTFLKNEQVTFVDGGGAGHDVTIAHINSVQAAILNGTLSDVAGTEAPLEPADNLRVIFTVNSHASQKDVSGATVATAYKANFDFISA